MVAPSTLIVSRDDCFGCKIAAGEFIRMVWEHENREEFLPLTVRANACSLKRPFENVFMRCIRCRFHCREGGGR